MLKFLLKIYPAFLPILLYVIWVYVVEGLILKRLLREKNIIEGEKIVGQESTEQKVDALKITKFSLKNRFFVMALYASFLLAILTLVFSAFF